VSGSQMRFRVGWPRKNETLITLCVQVMLMMMGMGLISPMLPQFAQTFGVSVTMVGLLITGFGVARIVTAIPSGKLAGRVGRRPLIVAGPVVLAVGSAACGMAASYWQLFAFYFVQGVGSGMHSTSAMMMLADISKPTNRGRVMSLYQGTMLLGLTLGPVLGGFLAQCFGLRVPFFVYAFLAVLAVVWAYLRLPETRPSRAQEQEPAPVGDSLPRAGPSLGFRPLLRDPNFVLIAGLTFVGLFMRTGVQYEIIPLLGSSRLGLEEGGIGLALGVAAVLQFITIFAGGRLSDRFGRKVVITPACLVAGLSLVMLALSESIWFLFLSCAVLGVGIGVGAPTPAAYLADVVPRENYGSGIGLYRSITDVGIVVGPLVLGVLADLRGFSFALFFNAGLLVLAVLLFQAFAKEPSRKGA